MSTEPPEYTEEQLRALEAELERVTVDEVLVQTMVSLLNLGARKAGLAAAPGTTPNPDWAQTQQAIDAVRALLPLIEPRHPQQAGALRDMLSQLQMAYAQLAPGAGPGAGAPPAPGPAPGAPGAGAPAGAAGERPQGDPGTGPAQRSGRLWIPGQ
jgi:hypothetical protein